MILVPVTPRTKTDLLRVLQRQTIQQIEVIEPYDSTREQELLTKAKAMAQRSGDLTIILLRTS
jgi:hypothetical protein